MGALRRLVLLGVLLLGLLAPRAALGQQVHRNAFESMKTFWVKSGFDAPFDENIHSISDQVCHDGQHSEYISLEAKPGNFIYYQYPSGRVPIGEEMSAAIWLKANRPGVQLMARIVLPNERDPTNLDNRLTTLIRGDIYRNAGRWQRLELGRGSQLAKQQQQLMQAQLKRPLNFTDAYIDNLVLNVYAGPGLTEVWIDDLEIGPVMSDAAAAQPGTVPGVPVAKPGAAPRPGARNLVVDFNGNQLSVGGKRIFFKGVRLSDTPLRILRDAGFNTVFLDQAVSPALLQEATDLGFWIVPQLKVLADDARSAADDDLAKDIARFTENDAVLFWYLSSTLSNEQTARTSRDADMIRKADPGRPIGADVWDGLVPYSRILNLVGVHRWPLMTTLELPRYREWLEQRQRLANPGTFTWTWIQTHTPEWFTQILFDRPSAGAFSDPVGPQAEQIRLLTYTALASGCKGLGFWSDRFLADSHQGRDRLLCCALLNQELEMLEPLLVSSDSDTPEWIDTSVPDVKAAVVRTAKGVLVIPIWQGKGGQFVPGQAALSKLSLTVPQVPQSMQAWDVTPADVRGLRPERVAGGTKITLPEFGLTSTIVFTSDTGVLIRLQEQARNRRQVAAQYTNDMAQYELAKVLKVQEKLESQGHTLPDAHQLMADAQARLKTAKERWDNHDFAEAYREAERSLRPARILMRAQWDQAVKGLDSPVSSPYAVTFFTLPRHWQFMDEIKRSTVSANLLPGGDFEMMPERTQDTWKLEQGKSLDDVDMVAQRVSQVTVPADVKGKKPARVEAPQQGKQCALLQIKPKKGPAPFALERTFLAVTSPSVALQPGSLVQVSGWIRIPA
ncbi:MAG TPA: hypothetical protein VNX28_04755, partial [Gemmataceae bacterium]|nr:hypothetical protein [Gemmataceae bacterium]